MSDTLMFISIGGKEWEVFISSGRVYAKAPGGNSYDCEIDDKGSYYLYHTNSFQKGSLEAYVRKVLKKKGVKGT